MDKFLKVVDYFKAPYIWQKTGYKPTVKIEEKIIYFQFPDKQEYRDAVNSFLAGEPCPNIKEYVSMFKVLRGEMMVTKNQVRFQEDKKSEITK